MAKKERNKNLLIYDAINKILIKNKILAPKLLNQNYNKNYIEIQDLGNQTIYQLFKSKKKNNYLILKEVIKVLNKIQLIKNKKIKTFKKKYYKIKSIKYRFYLMRLNYFVIGMFQVNYKKRFIFHLTISLKKRLNFYCQN